MKNVKFVLGLVLSLCLIAAVATVFVSCSDDDDEPSELTLTALTADGIDLNGATSPSDIPLDAVITATFSTDVDAASVSPTTVKLTRDYDDAVMDATVATSGKTITITPDEALGSGSLYIVRFETGLMSTGGKALAAAVERNFTTEGTFAPAGVMAHFTFEDVAEDVVDGFDPGASDVVDITYVDSRNAAAGKAASFNGTTSLIEVPNADDFLGNDDFTIAFWVKANSTKNSQFVLGLAAWYGFQFEIAGDWTWVKLATRYDQGDGTTDAEDAWFPGDGKTKDNGGWQGWTFQKDVTASGGVGDTYFKDKWAHVVVTYNAATKINTMYINGERVKEHDFNLWPSDSKKKNITGVAYAGNPDGNKLAIGFIQGRDNPIVTDAWAQYSDPANNHFKGEIDDLRFFSVPVTDTEVSLMYNSEKP
jgi:hypothetical protein